MELLAAQVKMPISKINPKSQCSRKFRLAGWAHQQGFTLIELMVVLAIGAMLFGLVPFAFERMRDGSQYRDTVRAIVTDLRQAHRSAVFHGQPVAFTVDLAGRQFGIEGLPLKVLPAMLEVRTTAGTMESATSSLQARYVFLPEGGSTGGTIELVRRSGAGVRIRVDWLFGQVTQEPRTP